MKGILALVLLVGAGWLVWSQLLAPPPRTSSVSSVPSQPAPTPAAGEVSVVLDEPTLTSQLNGSVSGRPLGDTPLGPATARDLAVELRGGQVRVTGQAQAGGASLPISLTGTVQAQSEKAVVDVRDARLGSVPLPEAAREQIEQALQGHLDRALASQPIRVRAVTVSDGRLTVIGARS